MASRGIPVSWGVLGPLCDFPRLPFVTSRSPGAPLVPRGFPLWCPFDASLLWIPGVPGRPYCHVASLCGLPVFRGVLGAPWLPFVGSRGFPVARGVLGAPWLPFDVSLCGFPVSLGILGAILVPIGFPLWLPGVPGRPWCSVAFLCGFPWLPFVSSRRPEASLVPRGFPVPGSWGKGSGVWGRDPGAWGRGPGKWVRARERGGGPKSVGDGRQGTMAGVTIVYSVGRGIIPMG